jgi:Rrf2 family protein
MLSHTCKTAIKAVIYLASLGENERSGIRDVASSIDASEHTVGKILQSLAREGIIHSAKGPNGGFYIANGQRSQPILKIIEAIDGKEVFKECGLGLSRCSATHPCPIHDQYKSVRDEFEKLCANNRISDLCGPVNTGLAYLVN